MIINPYNVSHEEKNVVTNTIRQNIVKEVSEEIININIFIFLVLLGLN